MTAEDAVFYGSLLLLGLACFAAAQLRKPRSVISRRLDAALLAPLSDMKDVLS